MTRWITDELNCHHTLDMDPWHEYTPEEWMDRLEKFRKDWNDEFAGMHNDIITRGNGYKMMQLVPAIRKRVTDARLIESDSRDAKVLVHSFAQKLLRDCVTTPDGVHHVFMDSAENLINSIRWSSLDPERLLSVINGVEHAPENPFKIPTIQAANFLMLLDVDTPLQLLNSLLTDESLEIRHRPLTEDDDYETFQTAFVLCESRIKNINRQFEAKDIYTEALRRIKQMMRKNPEELENVSRYISAMKVVKKLMKNIVNEKGYNLGSSYLKDLMDMVLQLNDDRELINRLIACQCYTLHIPIDMTSDDVDTIRCPECGTLLTNRTMVTCAVCNIDLRNICPRCGSGSDISSESCPYCKYSFIDKDPVLESYCEIFDDQISQGLTESAKNTIDKFRPIYPHYRNLPLMKKSLDDLGFLAEFNIEEAEKLHHSGRYYSALDKYKLFKTSFPELYMIRVDVQSNHRECLSRVSDAETLLTKASNSIGNVELMMLKDASVRCPDHPIVLDRISKHPPLAPKNAISTSATGGIFIKFECDDDSITSFGIVRVDSNTGDVTDLGMTSDRHYMDQDAPVGVLCRYRVYSYRGFTKSTSYSMTLDSIALADVSDTSSRVDELGVHLSFTRPAHSIRTIITRKSDKDDDVVEFLTNSNGFHDNTVEDGTRYVYHITSEFEIHGDPILTPGVDICATSLSHPHPVNNLEIKLCSNGEYAARWECEDSVELYLDPDVNGKPLGTVEIERFNSSMTRIEPTRLFDKGMRFKLDVYGQVGIVPVSRKGGFGREGAKVVLTKVEPFRNIRAHLINDSCLLTMEWPPNTHSAQIELVDDMGPSKPVLVTRESYINSGGAYIPLNNRGMNYINIRAAYDARGTKLYSDTTTIRVNSGEHKMLTYDVSRDSKGSTVTINVPPDLERIPSIQATTRINGIPLTSEDGSIVWQSHVPVPVVNGTAEIRMEGVDFGPNTRLFFRDSMDYESLYIIHPLSRGDVQ